MYHMNIRQIPDYLEKRLRQVARQKNNSLNKTVIELLKKALGFMQFPQKKRNFSGLAGGWSEKDVKEFTNNTKIFEKIDSEIWGP